MKKPILVVAVAGTILSGLLAPASADVVGGRPASEEYPFMVSLQVKETGSHNCGGTLVHKQWVLTAAHCVFDVKPEELQVMGGSHFLSEPGPVIAVAEVLWHEAYESTGNHDVALLKLTTKAPYAPIRIAGLHERSLWEAGVESRALGWGRNFFIVGQAPDQLQEVDLPIVGDEDCDLSYTFQGFDPTVEVCAGETEGGKDTCQGDSGGPLMVKDAKGRWVQMGVTSWGNGCAVPLMYGIYSRVAGDVLRPWLAAHIPGPN